MKIEKLSKYTLEELVVIFRDIFPSEEDQSSIEECFRSSLNGGPVEGVKELEYFVTRKDSKIVGAIGLYSTPEDFREALWIGWYGVHPPHRNKGIGTNLLKFSIREAKKRGAKYLRAYTSTDPNEHAAHRLYEKHGLIKVKEEFLDGDNILTYELKL